MPHNPLPLLPLVLDDVPRGLRQALAQEGIPCCDRREGTPEGRFILFDSRGGQCAAPAAGQTLIDVDSLRGPAGDDPLAALVDERSARFQWRVSGMTLIEAIARVDKRAVRRRVLDRLRERIEAAGGIWLRLAAFPFPYRSAFTFRIDHDEYIPKDFDALMDAIAGREDATSHYVNGSAYESAAGAWPRLRGLDVGSHGYWHHTYRTEEENFRNIRRGIEALQAAGIEPRGFTAPHGRFNPALASAMTRLGITHSGEFGLAYDELPFVPVAGGPLQIPVHPVCLGLFLEAARRHGGRSPAAADARVRAAVLAAGDYFSDLARARYRLGEPVFFYGHPNQRLGRYPEVLRRVFDAVDEFGAIWKTTASRFAAWWHARTAVRISVTQQGDRFLVSADATAPGWRLGIEHCRGKHVALMPLDKPAVCFSPEALAYENRSQPTSFHPVRVDWPGGFKAQFRRMIDWERVTPVEEIGPGGWRNAAKRTLRRWRR